MSYRSGFSVTSSLTLLKNSFSGLSWQTRMFGPNRIFWANLGVFTLYLRCSLEGSYASVNVGGEEVWRSEICMDDEELQAIADLRVWLIEQVVVMVTPLQDHLFAAHGMITVGDFVDGLLGAMG